MSDIAVTLNSQSSFIIPKLHNDGSNWADYEPWVKNAMGAKGLTNHVEGRARQPTPLTEVNNVPMSWADPTVAATETEIESAEKKIDDYEWNEAHAKHIILSTTSPRLSSKIKAFATAKEMWDAVKADVSNKSMLQQIDILEQLQEMHCSENADADAHLLKITKHFRLMEEHRDQLATMGSPVGEAGFLALVLKSIPVSYHPTVQTINTNLTLTSRVSTTPNTTPSSIAASDIITLFIHEARHRTLQHTRDKGGAAMYVVTVPAGTSDLLVVSLDRQMFPLCFLT